MIVILHAEDSKDWLDNVLNLRAELGKRLRQPVEILCRDSIERAESVIHGTGERMRELIADGNRLDLVVLDLMMKGGTSDEIGQWVEGIETFGTGLTLKDIARICELCPALELGRKAAKVGAKDGAKDGAKVIILTQAKCFLPKSRDNPEAENGLLMEACGASAYIIKDDRWGEELLKAAAAALTDS